jgi:hypothetical protein
VVVLLSLIEVIMKRQVKHTTQTSQEQEQLSQTQAQHTAAREFTSVEEALREDREQVTVPPAVEQRLSKSIEHLPKPGRPWWKRLMGD